MEKSILDVYQRFLFCVKKVSQVWSGKWRQNDDFCKNSAFNFWVSRGDRSFESVWSRTLCGRECNRSGSADPYWAHILIALAADNKKDSFGHFLFASAKIWNEMLNVSWAKKRAGFVFVLSTSKRERERERVMMMMMVRGKKKRKAMETDKRQDRWREEKEAEEDGWRCGLSCNIIIPLSALIGFSSLTSLIRILH